MALVRVKKSEIKGFLPNILKKKEPVVAPSKDRSDEILAAIKKIKVEPPKPVIVEKNVIPDELLSQQREILDEMQKKPELPTYHFDVNRNSQGFIKNVIASPVSTGDKEGGKIADSWYGNS